MRPKRVLQVVLSVVAIAAVIIGCAAATDNGGKMPITTASEKAKEAYLQGRDLQERLRAADALPYFQRAVAEDPNFAVAHLNLALTAPSAKEFFASMNKAASLAEKASDGERLWILGFQAGVNGDPEKQRGLYTELANAYPEDERAQNILGGFYFGQQEWNKAIGQYEKAISINPEFSQPYNQLGYAYRFLGKYADAEKAFKRYIEVLPDDPNPYDSYAELLMKLGRYDESIKNYQKALTINPTFVASHLGIASDYNFKADGEAARAQIQKMYDGALNSGQRRAALQAKSISYVFEGDLDKALEAQEQRYAIAEEIDDVAAMSGDLGAMGNILVEFGHAEEARQKYEKSLNLIQDSDQSEQQKELARRFHHFNICKVLVSEGHFDEAEEHAAALKKQADASENAFQIRLAHEMAGTIALGREDYDKAVEELKQANQQNPYNLYRLAMAYEGKGDRGKSQELYKQAVNFNALTNMNQAFVSQRSKKMMSAK